MAINNVCMTRDALRDYLAGWSPAELSDDIEAHLQQCPECEQTLLALEQDSDTLCELLRGTAAPTEKIAVEAAAEAVVAYAIQKAANAMEFAAERCEAPMPVPKRLGPYELLHRLGSGGMGAVYLAIHQTLRKTVAIKLLPATAFRSDQYAARFQREIRAAGQLHHPSVVSATDAGQDADIHYLVMEYIDGLDMSQVARGMGPLPLPDACEIGRALALGLAHAHALGIVHRDVKPSNIMLSRSGEVKILDFGLAQSGLWDDVSAELTTVGQLMGTLDYMAPEQAEQPSAVDYRADLYSLGATLFRLLCGRAPLAAAPDMSPMSKLRLLHEHPAPSLATLRPEAPRELVELVDRLLDRRPDRRPASAAHVAEALARWASEANLVALITRAIDQQTVRAGSAEPLNKALDASGLRVARRMDPTGSDAQAVVQPQVATNGSRGWERLGRFVALALLPLGLLAGVLITIELQKGELVIDSQGANVDVQLLQDGAVYDRVTVQPGANVTRIFAGKYQIVVDQASDQFELEQDSIAIRRGEAVVVRLTRRDGTKPAASELAAQPSPGLLNAIPPQPPSTASIEPGDLLEIVSYGDSSLNRQVTVMTDYVVKLPLVGLVSVRDKNPQQLEGELIELYKEYIAQPSVEIYRSRPMVDLRGTTATTATTATAGATRSDAVAAGDALTYNGQTLNEWLQVLDRERNPEGMLQALEAIGTLANSETSELVAPRLLNLLPRLQLDAKMQEEVDSAIWRVLLKSQTSPQAFGEFLLGQLKSGDRQVAERFFGVQPDFSGPRPSRLLTDGLVRFPADYAPLVDWMVEVLTADRAHPLLPAVARYVRFAYFQGVLDNLQNADALIRGLTGNPQLGADFWLADVLPTTRESIQSLESVMLRILGDVDSDLDQMTRASLVITYLNGSRFDRLGAERVVLTPAAAANAIRHLRDLSQEPARLVALVDLPASFANARTYGLNAQTIPLLYERNLHFNLEAGKRYVALPALDLLRLLTQHAAMSLETEEIVNRIRLQLEPEIELLLSKLSGKMLEVSLDRSRVKDERGNDIQLQLEQAERSVMVLWAVTVEGMPKEEQTAYLLERLAPLPAAVTQLPPAMLEWSVRQISKYDTDGNGRLSDEEIQSMLVKPTGADSDQDGYITAEEYAAFRLKK